MRTIGSPPNGLSLKRANPAKVTRNRPSSTASAWNPVKGSRNRRFRRTVVCPSGVLRSSAVSAMNLPESAGPTIPRRGKAAADPAHRAPAKANLGFAALSRRDPSRKKGGPKAALFAKAGQAGSVRLFVGGLVDRRLVTGGRRGRIDLDAVEQVVGHLQRLVVLGVRRHVGLRTGLLVAFGFQMAAQRGFALGIGPRLPLVGHVLHHLDVGNDALGLDRLARRREIARRGEAQRAVAASERNDGLHRALAERAGADQRGP